MRRLAMRFLGILRSSDIQKFAVWLDDAQQSGLYAMQRFIRTVRRDVDAVTNALTEGWSNGQTEGQINRLKTLKRAMYGRAGAELLRARMLPLHSPISARKVRQTHWSVNRVRCRIEKIFGTWKRSYGLRRMRWQGIAKGHPASEAHGNCLQSQTHDEHSARRDSLTYRRAAIASRLNFAVEFKLSG